MTLQAVECTSLGLGPRVLLRNRHAAAAVAAHCTGRQPWRFGRRLEDAPASTTRARAHEADFGVTPPGQGNASADTEDTIEVGAIGEAHGLRGDVKVIPLTDFVDQRFQQSAEFQLKTSTRMGAKFDKTRDKTFVTISTVRVVDGKNPSLVIKFEQISNRDEAEALKGFLLTVPQEQRPHLEDEEDEFYASDLVGLTVKDDSTGQVIGRVREMADLGAPNLLMEVELAGEDDDGDRRTVLIPFVKQLVPTVDLESGVIGIDPPDGLLQLYRNDKGSAQTSTKPHSSWKRRRRRDDVRKLKQRLAESSPNDTRQRLEETD